MKIIIFLNRDIEANIAFNLMKSELLNHSVRIYYSDSVGKSDKKPAELQKLEHFEREFFFKELAEFQKTNNIESDFNFFNEGFQSYPFNECNDLHSSDLLRELVEFAPDLFISIRFGKIFKNEMITIPKYGILNLHSAILPQYRGILGTLQAILNQEKEIGCTLHTIPDSGIDTGDVLNIARASVVPEKSLFWHIIHLYPLGIKLILEAVNHLENGRSLSAMEQNKSEGNYYSLPTVSDFQKLKQMGREIISVEDYCEILTQFVFRDINTDQKKQLEKFVGERMIHFN